MDAAVLNDDGDHRLRVSITTRLIAMVAFTIPLIGGALSSFMLMSAFKALRSNETAGLGAIMGGMKWASFPAIVSLYLAAFFGLVVVVVLVVRMFVQTKTASPPFWYFVLGGILCLLPAAAFWKAQLLILEVFSPGSTIGAAGISGVAADLSQLLWMSIIAAPIVFVILIVASVVPLSSRPGRKVGSLIVATVVALSFIAAAVGVPFLIDGPKRKNEIVALPASVKYVSEDSDLAKESSMVLTLSADNKLYQRQEREVNGKVERTETVITKEELPGKITTAMEGKSPEKRIVYVKCDINAAYENVVQVFEAIRKADVDKVGLVVLREKNAEDPNQITPYSFEVRLQERIDTSVIRKPNPLTLVAALDKDGKVSLNNEPKGTIADASRIETTLKNIFKDRIDNGVFREGTNEIEKLTYIKAPKSSKYSDFIKLVDAVRGSGGDPIGIQIDDVN